MAKFRGTVQGGRGEASRLGHKSIEVEAQSWQGKVVVNLFEANGKIIAHVSLAPHHNAGTSKLIFEGPVNGEAV